MATPVLAVPSIMNGHSGTVNATVIMNALAIRDTSAHDPTTDTPGTNTFLADLTYLPGGRLVYINNTLNQTISVQLVTSYDLSTFVLLGYPVTVPTSTQTFIDVNTFHRLLNPYQNLGVRITALTSPASGTVTASLVAATAHAVADTVKFQIDGPYRTYAASIVALATATTATDIAGLYNNSAGIIKVCHLILTYTQQTGADHDIYLVKRTAKNTGTAAQTPTPVPYDTNDVAANGVVVGYTANPSALGASAGNIAVQHLFGGSGSAIGTMFDMVFGAHSNAKQIILRQNEGIYFNLNSTTISSPSFDIYFEWVEL